ncbi:S-layer homology domain-containing protein [Solibacillus sp. FSL H8-0538]|uniref:S-layer homology domain-containing protein n=1 Tax=Solibacillus sp. FSL H8-0538 TaxID=2921400 RepID=UPI0030F5777B
MGKFIFGIITLVFCLSIILPSCLTFADQVFNDVSKKHSYYKEIMYLYEKGVIEAATNFGVKEVVTREEAAVWIAKAAGLNGTQRSTKFSDVHTGHKNSGYIQSAAEAGIIHGYNDGTYQLNANVTRGHMAALIARAFKLPVGTTTFSDVRKGHTAYKAVSQLAATNITTGYTDGTFKPNAYLTRAHFATFLARAMQYSERTTTQAGEMNVHFIDVGQGDAIVIQSPNGKTMLIDAGTQEVGGDIARYLQALHIKRIDTVVVSHPDANHIGGFLTILDEFPVDHFINSGKAHLTTTNEAVLNKVAQNKIRYSNAQVGTKINFDSSLHVQVLHVNPNSYGTNDASIVLKVTYNDVSFLFTGDASVEVEEAIAAKYNVAATVLKAGQHGSSTSNSLAFLQKVKPNVTVLSYGKDNEYGYPHSKVISNLKAVHSKIYTTAQSGTIIVTTDGKTYRVKGTEYKAEAKANSLQ